MTRRKLNRIKYIKQEIRSWRAKLEELSTPLPGKGMDGMPHSTAVHSTIEARAIKNVELEQQIQSLLEELEEIESEVMNWILGIDDSYIRLLIKCRYLDGLSWDNTAIIIGSGTTSDSCKQTLSRWMREQGID